ncbi:MAG: SPOR domain-containing protein [Bacteroidales bacterium]|nr:SPOR domain-containing protein [Bacteroidales bacterium]
MNRIYDAIAALLYDHDAVIVPGLGAFLRHDEGAKVNVITNQFERPSSTISFDSQQREENDLLVHYLVAHDNISEEDARQQLAMFVSDCYTKLKSGEVVTFPEVGAIAFNGNQELVFEAVETSNFNADAFGLSDLNPQPLFGGSRQDDWKTRVAAQIKDQNTPMTVDEKSVHQDMGDEDNYRKGRWKRVLSAAFWAVLCVLAVVCILYFLEVIHLDIPIKPKPVPQVVVDAPEPDSAILAEMVSYYHEPVTAPIDACDTIGVIDTIEVIDTIQVTETVQETVPDVVVNPVDETVAKAILPYAELLPYSVIAGCFSQQANAENYLTPIQEQGYPGAFLMQRGSMYYVCFGQYATIEEAKTALADIKANANNKAWILTK